MGRGNGKKGVGFLPLPNVHTTEVFFWGDLKIEVPRVVRLWNLGPHLSRISRAPPPVCAHKGWRKHTDWRTGGCLCTALWATSFSLFPPFPSWLSPLALLPGTRRPQRSCLPALIHKGMFVWSRAGQAPGEGWGSTPLPLRKQTGPVQ